MSYPFKFRKVLKEKVWGGEKLNSSLGINLQNSHHIGESWEVSTHKNGISFIANGSLKNYSFASLLLTDRAQVLGEEVVELYGDKFPILVKFLDINDKLSIQVHPDNSYAKEVENELGKEESWYILDASDDAEVIMGLNSNISKSEFEEAVKKNNFTGIFNSVKVKKGDIIHIRPGVVHGTLKGEILICEVQQNSDITYRVYDFDRTIDGEKRLLHIEKSMNVIDFKAKPDIKSLENRSIKKITSGEIDNLVSCNYYNITRLFVDGLHDDGSYKNFRIFSILDGTGDLKVEKKSYHVEKGDTFLVPANLPIQIIGKELEVLKVFL